MVFIRQSNPRSNYHNYLFLPMEKYNWKGLLLITISIACTIILTDQLSVHLFKDVFLRYRPSHNLEISPLLHFYEFKPGELYLGGQYGFISSHAANYFGFIGLVVPLFYLKNKGFYIFSIHGITNRSKQNLFRRSLS